MRPQAAASLAAVPAALVGAFALVSLLTSLPDFFDPCHEWGSKSGPEDSATELTAECRARSASSQTRGEALFGLFAIQGVMFVGSLSAVMGGIRLDRAWTGAGAALIATMVPPLGLGILWVVPLIAALLIIVAAIQMPRQRHRERRTACAWPYAVGCVGVGLVTIFLATAATAALAALAAGIGASGIFITFLLDRATNEAPAA